MIMSLKQRKRKYEPRIKLNPNIYKMHTFIAKLSFFNLIIKDKTLLREHKML